MNTLRFVGKIKKSRGTDGSFVVSPLMEALPELTPGDTVSIGFSARFTKQYTVEHCNVKATSAILRLREFSSRESIRDLFDKGLFLAEDVLRREREEEWFDDEVIGCEVFDEDSGASLGHVVDIWNLPTYDAWVVANNAREFPIPAIPEFVTEVDISASCVKVRLPEGLTEIGVAAHED